MKKGQEHKQKRKARNSFEQRVVAYVDTSVSLFLSNLQSLVRKVRQSGVLHVNSASLKRDIRELVKNYFQNLRVEFVQNGLDTINLDQEVQALLSCVNSRTRVSLYLSSFSAIEKTLKIIESQELIALSNKLIETKKALNGFVVIGQDKKIIDVLSKILPPVALSYQQVLADTAELRLSYKGTAGELREILREVLNYLAPDAEVLISPGFKLEKDKRSPTMKQKVRFILKSRNKSHSAIEAPENAVAIVEESIAKLARATYDRGSLSAHTATEKIEILNLKRYLDSVLCELLEIY